MAGQGRMIALLTAAPSPALLTEGSPMQKLLAEAGIRLEDCFVACVGDPGWRIALAVGNPNMALCLGSEPLSALLGRKASVDDWRGTLWRSETCGLKCLATYPPERLMKEYALSAVVRLDLKRVREEMVSSELRLPERRVDIADSRLNCGGLPPQGLWLSKAEALEKLSTLRQGGNLISLDIEGSCGLGPACIGFSTDPAYAFVIPFYGVDGVSIWCEADEVELWEAVAALLEDAAVPKCIMNALYECFVLAWTLGIVIRGIEQDVMLSHFELFCEMEKSLEFQASIYTRQPFWKLEHRRQGDRYVPYKEGRPATNEEWFTYNGTDCCVTAECFAAIERRLLPRQREHYRFQVECLEPLLYLMLKGIHYDKERAKAEKTKTQRRIWRLQDRIQRSACSSDGASRTDGGGGGGREKLQQLYGAVGLGLVDYSAGLVDILVESFCRRNGADQARTVADVHRFAKDSRRAECRQALRLVAQSQHRPFTSTERGELAALCGLTLNVHPSSKDAAWLLYDCWHLKGSSRATDEESVLKLWSAKRDRRVLWFLTLRRLQAKLRALEAIETDPDGRLRSSYNLAGSERCELACYGSLTGTPAIVSVPFETLAPDEGCVLWRFRLRDPEEHVLSAYAASFGDHSLWQALASDTLSPEERRILKPVAYDLGRIQMSHDILWSTYAKGRPSHVAPKECDSLKRALLARRPGLQRYQEWLGQVILDKGEIASTAGFTRRLYGRRSEFKGGARVPYPQTLRAALEHLPRFYATYATLKVLHRLWNDPANRREDGSLGVEPVHVDNGELWVQVRADDVDADERAGNWLLSEVLVANETLVLPWEKV